MGIAVLWTISLAINLLLFALGGKPTWTMVLCPSIMLCFQLWDEYCEKKKRR